MDWAHNSDGKDVLATSGVARGIYWCPVCGVRVRFVPETEAKRAYFAHFSGQASEDCEFYHPGQNVGTRVDIFRPSSDAASQLDRKWYSELKLVLRTQKTSSSFQWDLAVRIPKSNERSGKLSLRTGPGESKEIRIEELALHESYFQVSPLNLPYKAMWTSPEVDPSFRDVVVAGVDGLQLDQIAVFRFQGRHNDRAAILRGGARYYCVYPESVRQDAIETLGVDRVWTKGPWSCAILDVPDVPSDAYISTLEQSTGLKYTSPELEATLLSLCRWRLDAAARVTIDRDDSLVFAIRRLRNPSSAVVFQVDGAGGTLSASVPGGHVRSFVAVRPDATEGSSSAIVSLNDQVVCESVCIDEDESKTMPELTLSSASGALGFHTEAARRFLADYRQKPVPFTLHIPEGIQGIVETDNGERAVVTDDTASQERFQNLLLDAKCAIRIDFGGFGRFLFEPDEAVPRNELGTLERRQARAIVSVLMAEHGVPIVPHGVISDADLVETLRNNRDYPRLQPQIAQFLAGLIA